MIGLYRHYWPFYSLAYIATDVPKHVLIPLNHKYNINYVFRYLPPSFAFFLDGRVILSPKTKSEIIVAGLDCEVC